MNALLAALVQAGALTASEAEQLGRMLDNASARQWAEGQISAAFGRGLANQRSRLVRALEQQGASLRDPALTAFWADEARELARDVLPTLTTVGQEMALASVVRSGGLDAWTAVNEGVIGWVEDYYIGGDASVYGSIRALNDTTRTQVGSLINAWQRGELEANTAEQGLPRLLAAMDDLFGAERGAVIGVTETTRVFSLAIQAAAELDPNITQYRWLTGRDEYTCDICGPLDGATVAKGELFDGGLMPPAHPNCRCSLATETDLTAQVDAGAGGAGTWNYVSQPT